MKSVVLLCVFATSALGHPARPKTVPTTRVTGESWLNHLHRAFEVTSMGKTYRLGPSFDKVSEETHAQAPQLPADARRQALALRGSDLYRLNCWGCHGEFGLGAPPEINSVINPTKATSTQLVMKRMKGLGMDMSRADAAQLANESKAALLQRLHKGGTDMPAFPYLNEAEVDAIVNYLRLLAGIPGAEKQQAVVNESSVRVGEHVVKSTCHICHNAAGLNPDPQQVFDGTIPPLNTLTTRVSLPEFEQKIRSGAPIMMGTPPSPLRGRMPVFNYLRQDEVADAYLYLTLYPPDWGVPDPPLPAIRQKQPASDIVPAEFSVEPPNVVSRSDARDLNIILLPVTAALLITGGLWFTFSEIRRLTAISDRRKTLVLGRVSAVQGASSLQEMPLEPSPSNSTAAAEIADFVPDAAFEREDYRTFESSWFSRLIEREDKAA
ncbi:MAG: c-type cytochrome [Candidatus Sulfotelmatobacter sp.]|jgi:mono/diheme cytochrome c family protein